MFRLLMLLALVVTLAAPAPAAAGSNPPSEPRIQDALHHLAAGDTAAAIESLRRADLEKEGDPQWFALLGRLYRERCTIEGRQRSQGVLERAVQLHPGNADVALELGLTYFAQTFYPDAVRFFERALELDPELCIARYKLGVTHYERWKLRVNSFHDEIDEARRWLAEALACDPKNVDAAVRYMNATYAVGEAPQALIAAHAFALRFPHHPEFPLMAGVVAYENELLERADSAFTVALSLMDEDEAAAFTGLNRNVLGYDAMDEYDEAPENEQPRMERAYWVGADPDPTTNVNPSHLEHVTRTYLADVFYSHSSVVTSWTQPQTRGWETERGEILIKLGPPDEIHASHGGDRFEVWEYDAHPDPLLFAFFDRFGNGNLSIPTTAADELRIARYMDQVVQPDTATVYVDGAIDVVAFKDDNFSCSVYTLQHADADSIMRTVDMDATRWFEVRTRFFDEEWGVERDDAARIAPADLAVIPGSTMRLFDVIRRHDMPFGRYHVAGALADESGSVRAVAREVCDASHLARSELVTSQILFLRDGTGGASFARGGELLQPNPWRSYAPGQRVGLYVEIYNLSAVAGQNRYRVTYEIREDDQGNPNGWERMGRFVSRFVGRSEGDPVVAQSFERTGPGHAASERMTIDVSVLEPGLHRVTLTVEDLNSRERWETSRTFTLSAPGVEVANP